MSNEKQRSKGFWLVAVIVAISCTLVLATSDQASEIYIPGAAHVAGSNDTSWRTDLELRSVGTIGTRVRIDLLREGRDNKSAESEQYRLPPAIRPGQADFAPSAAAPFQDDRGEYDAKNITKHDKHGTQCCFVSQPFANAT